MDKRVMSSRGEPIPSILKKPKALRKGNFLNKSSKLKKERVEDPKTEGKVPPPLAQGCTPLMYACQQADYKGVVEILNKDTSTARVRDRSLRCALHYCASSGGSANAAARAACADRVLMAAPELSGARDADGLTPLHLAVVHGNVPLIQGLLAAGADVNATDTEHHTVVHWATVCGELGALRAVLAAGAAAATPDQHGGYPLHYAAQMCGAPATHDNQSRGAALEVLRVLVREGGADVSARDAEGRTPLLWAASAGAAAAVLALHQAQAPVDTADKDGLTALHCAAARGHTEALETLVGLCGARVDAADSHGCTALHYAVALGHADAATALLGHGADAQRQDKRGRSPAHTAAAKGQIHTMRILGANGANLWLRNSKGDLPLHEAVASGRRDLVKWLLDGRPSQVNATNHEGRTPLHIAAANDNADLCRLLLDRGAEINPVARSSKNEPLTPLDCAANRGHRSTAKYLQMHGGLPASKLTNTEIIIDGAQITGLPTRRVTSTKIDVRDRIRIEKREVVELSSPVPDRRYVSKKYSESSDGSSTDDKKRTKRKPKHTKSNERRKKLSDPQKSFSDGYETELENKVERKYKQDNRSKKNRSRSEPSRKSKSNGKNHRKYCSGSASSSEAQSYVEQKKNKRHRKHSKRKSSSSSESSTESSDIQSTKRKDKKTSIHIENDDKKQSVNIVKYIKPDNIKQDYAENKITGDQSKDPPEITNEITEKENQELKGDIESNTVSVKTNLIVTEAQIHMERENLQQENSEIIVTMDASNNVSIETTNMSVTHKDKDEIQKNMVESQGIEELQKTEKTTVIENSNEKSVETELTSEKKVSESKVDSSDPKETLLKSGEDQNVESLVQEISDNATDDKHNEIKGHDKSRRKSFQVLSSPEEMFQVVDTLQLGTMAVKSDERANISSPSVSFKSQEQIIESNELDKNTLNSNESQVLTEHENIDTEKTNNSSMKNSEEKRRDFNSTTESSTEINQNIDKGLVTVLDGLSDKDRALQQVAIESLSEDGGILLSQVSPRRKTSKDSINSRKGSIYENESYKVLSGVMSSNEINSGILKKSSKIDDSFANDEEPYDMDKILKESIYGRLPSVSDNELYGYSEANGRRKRFRKKGRTKSKTTIRSKSENSERGYESSGFMDSGFEPSPRVVQRRIMSPRLVSYYQQRNTNGKFSGKLDSRIPVRKPGDKRAVDMRSVTQRIQTNMRRYYCERKIFQHLLELKRLQIRTSKTNEAVLVKRAIDDYNNSSLSHVALGPYSHPDYSFSSFEKFLYESLRKLQKSGKKHLDNLPEKPIEFDYSESELYKMSGIPDNPCLCTNKTHRCFHAVHAYTGIPCSAYIPSKLNHHTMLKPATAGGSMKSRGFLPKINSKSSQGTGGKGHVTLEVSHGTEKQLIALPAEKLDKNKRYYVTFTVKGSEPASDNEGAVTNKSIKSS